MNTDTRYWNFFALLREANERLKLRYDDKALQKLAELLYDEMDLNILNVDDLLVNYFVEVDKEDWKELKEEHVGFTVEVGGEKKYYIIY